MQAASEGHNDIVIELLSHNASKHIDTQDTGKRQWNALSYAAHFGELEVVKTLLKHGANQQNKGTTAFHVAQQKGHREVMSYLENYRFNIEGTTALMKAATRGNNKQVLKLLAEKALVDVQDAEGSTALIRAVKWCKVEVVPTLLAHKAAIDIQDKQGMTALMYAAFACVDAVTPLLEHEASLDIQDNKGITALIYAASQNHYDAASTLLASKANVDIQEIGGYTALMYAAINGNEEIFTLLLDNKATVDTQNNDGETALIIAEKKGKENISIAYQEKLAGICNNLRCN